jgi:hypothetical protein
MSPSIALEANQLLVEQDTSGASNQDSITSPKASANNPSADDKAANGKATTSTAPTLQVKDSIQSSKSSWTFSAEVPPDVIKAIVGATTRPAEATTKPSETPQQPGQQVIINDNQAADGAASTISSGQSTTGRDATKQPAPPPPQGGH